MSKSSSPAKGAGKTHVGVWQLKSRVDLDADGKRHIDPFLGPNPVGILTFSQDHFAAQFMNRDRVSASTGAQGTQGSNNTNAVNGYDAYFGTYRFDPAAGKIITRLEGAISPSNIGSEFERGLRVNGDELTITLATTAADGTPVTRTLTFDRLM